MTPEPWLWHIEIGTRAALYTETGPRDQRWFRWLFEKGRR